MAKVGISGLPGSGKTTALIKCIDLLEKEGYTVGGVVTEEIREGNRRVGFHIMDWMTKDREVMAHVNIESRVKVGKYGVDVKTLDTIGADALRRALENADVIVIDEIGKMEVESKVFVNLIRQVLDSEKHIIMTIHKKSRNPLLQEIRRRDDVRILEITPVNRNILPYKIVKMIKGEIE